MPIIHSIPALLDALDAGTVGTGDAVVVPDDVITALSRFRRTELVAMLAAARVELRVSPAGSPHITLHVGGATRPPAAPCLRTRAAASEPTQHPWVG